MLSEEFSSKIISRGVSLYCFVTNACGFTSYCCISVEWIWGDVRYFLKGLKKLMAHAQKQDANILPSRIFAYLAHPDSPLQISL